jgi:hypothetical protein
VLWPDTFNNYFHHESAIAATRVLEAAGCSVAIPREPLCCGRPMYDFGLLDQAKVQLTEIMRALEPEIRAGIPIIGLEPACVSVFKDELPNLFPDNELAHMLSAQVVYFSDFLHGDPGLSTKGNALRALVHGHCHHKAIIGMNAELGLLKQVGVQANAIESSCCGMAGSFGFRPETYALSVRAAELNLLPAVRAASAEELIVASGYSCREQIDQLSARKALHVAEASVALIECQPRLKPRTTNSGWESDDDTTSYVPLEDGRNDTPRDAACAQYGFTPGKFRRAHVPCFWSFANSWQSIFREGVCDPFDQELYGWHVSRSVKCEFCGNQRSSKALAGVNEARVDDLINFESAKYNEREKAALAYAEAITWRSVWTTRSGRAC